MDACSTHIGVPDPRTWLASSAEATAVAAADAVLADLVDTDPACFARRIEEAGFTALFGWAEAVTLAGLDREPWAREAALRAVRAYAERIGELMEGAGEGGRA